MPGATGADADQFKAAAAQIADNAMRLPEAGHDAECRIIGLFGPVKNTHRLACHALHFSNESCAIAGIPGGGRCQHIDGLYIQMVAQEPEAAERSKGGSCRLFGKLAGRCNAAAETGKHLFIEQDRRGACFPFIDHKTDRIRSDVDHRNWPAAVEPAAGRGCFSVESATLWPLHEGFRSVSIERFATARK